jgi:YggT family protein
MISANGANALLYLVSTLFELYLWVLLLRVILQWVRADFYNPFSQFIWKVTQPVLRWLQPVIPRWRNIEGAAILLALVVACLYVEVMLWLQGRHLDFASVVLTAALRLVSLTLNLYTFTLFIQAILSWVGPGVSNPVGSVLWSMNEPLLRPVRRLIPPVSGLDLSPLVVIVLLQFLNRLLPIMAIFP